MTTVLIVDSEPLEAASLQSMLEDDDYTFVTLRNADEAKQFLAEVDDPVGVILLDWMLEDSDGLALLTWIKGQDRFDDVEVVVHATDFDPLHVRRGIEAGAYYYLTKPFDEPQLEAIIRAAVRTFELRQSLRDRVGEAEDVFRLLENGLFRFQSVAAGNLLAVHIASACGQRDAAIGLQELMINAVEHGNLGIAYDDKSALLAAGALESERVRRLELPENRDKFVEVALQRSEGVLGVTITDEGKGFDYARYMKMDKDRLFDIHGRGVLIAAETLNIEYTPPGNQVRIRLPLRGDALAALFGTRS